MTNSRLPHIATCVDDLAVIRSCTSAGINHASGVCQMNTCSPRAGRPSLGAWATFGLGTANQDLPAFVVIEDNHTKLCRETDKPIAGLLQDLKRRGLLDQTLVVWGGEFGRTPMGENRDTTGRNHHIDAFTMWFAGGGTKPGTIIGETDELGFNAVTDRAHVHDIHATILHLLGIDHKRLTFRFQGRDFRLTDVHGHLIEKLLA